MDSLGSNPSVEDIKAYYPKYQGWNDSASVLADYKAGNYGETIKDKQFRDMQQAQINAQREAVRPAIESLEASKPEVSQKYATERERLESEKAPLNQRYDALIAEIKGEKAKAEVGTVKNLSREFSRRGIPLSSTVYGAEVEGALNPIRSDYTNMEMKTGFEREAGLKGISDLITKLVGDETGALREVTNAIAQLQAGAGQGGVQNALQMFLANMQNDMQMRSLTESKRQSDIANELAAKKFNEYDMPHLKYLLGKPYYSPNTGSGGGGTSAADDYYQNGVVPGLNGRYELVK